MPYPDIANPDLLRSIPLTARTVLDVGCGTGALGRDYRRLNPRARLFGIDSDPQSVVIAATRLHRAIGVDVETDPFPFGDALPPGSVDCITYGDVLEHLRDPWSLVRRHATLLRPDGIIALCVPNVEHWSFVERLLRGTWDYEDQGLFDAGHLRWFAVDAIRRGLLEAGLQPHDAWTRIFDHAQAAAFTRAAEPTLRALGVDPDEYLRRSAPLQYMFRAGLAPVERLTVVSTMLEPVGGVSDVRVIEPLRAMATLSSVQTGVVPLDRPPQPRPEAPRIFILHRPALIGMEGVTLIRRLLAEDYVVVCEFDDHPDFIPILQVEDVVNFTAVHAVQTTTETLAGVLGRANPEVAVFPNAARVLPEARNFTSPDRLTLFFGGLNREADWQPFLPGLNAAAGAAGARLQFSIVADRALFDSLDTPHKIFHPLCDYATYQDLLAQCEVSFMPLLDTPFNRCKSDLKALEAATHRVLPLASPVVYGDTLEDGRTGLLFNNAADLRDRLLRLVASPAAARTIADAARATVAAERMLAFQVERRVAWYRSLWERRAALTEALYERVPVLRP